MLTERAPAKINLTLEVLGRRPDGFHEIRSVVQAIDLCDYLHFDDGPGTAITCDLPGWLPRDSLVSRAVDLLREVTGSPGGVSIKVEKHIPLLSGLGGDSSDAAAVLLGLNRLWRLNLSTEEMAGLAVKLGSDTTFFVRGGTALMEGRGEKITPLPPPPEWWVVLVVPDVSRPPGKTGRMYAALKKKHFTDGSITETLVAYLYDNSFDESLLFNTFENVAFDEFPVLKTYKEHLIKLGAPHVHLAGSGPTLFSLYRDIAQAEEMYTACKKQGMEAYVASTNVE